MNKNCEICNKIFYARLRKERKYEYQKYCSKPCYWQWRKGKIFSNIHLYTKGFIPWNKSKSGYKTNYPKNRKKGVKQKGQWKHTENAKKRMSEKRSGKKHYNWQGGITPLNKQIRALEIYSEWRGKIFQRDNRTCQHCNKRGGKLNADHIKSFSKILNDNNIQTIEQAKSCAELWDLSNGRILCVNCHEKTDTYKGKSKKGKYYKCHD